MLGEATVFATLAVGDQAKSKLFYEGKLGLKPIEENPGGVMYRSGDGKIFVYQSPTAGTGKATSAFWMVSDIQKTVSDLGAAGISFESYDIPGASKEGDIYSMGQQKTAWFKDPDGNILSIGSRS